MSRSLRPTGGVEDAAGVCSSFPSMARVPGSAWKWPGKDCFYSRSMLSFALLKSPEENGLFSSYTLLHPRSPDSPPDLTVWVHGNLQAKEIHFQPGPVDGSWLAFGWLLFSLGLHQTRLWLIFQLCLYLTSRSLVDSNYC